MDQRRLEYDMVNAEDGEYNQALEVLRWGIDNYYPKIAIGSSFSVEDTIIIDIATQIEPTIKVLYINTGFQFQETEKLKERLMERYHLNLVEYSPLMGIEEQNRTYGSDLYDKDPDLCCKIRKVEPIKRALRELDAWITGLRREQATTRRTVNTVELEYTKEGRALTKINPLAHWTKNRVWQYIVNHQLPYNPLYDKGYTSIGCEPCTQPIQLGEDERAGRWAGKDKTECGIHTFTETAKPL